MAQTRKPPQRATKAPQAPEDPLADLRDPDDTLEGPEAPPEAQDDQPRFLPVADPSEQDHARAVLVATWHADLTSAGFLHKGGCGCRYLAQVAVDAIMPVATQDDDQEA